MKLVNLSRNLTVSFRAVAVCVLTFVAVAHLSSADDPTDDENPSTTNDGPLDEESEKTEDEVSDADKKLFDELLTFQRLLEENDESNREYSDDTRCIETRRIRHYQVLSERFVAFEMRLSDELYLIQFEQKCPGLQKNGSLAFEIGSGPGGRLCVSDNIKTLDSGLATQSGTLGSCRIPSIEKITRVQLIQLERGLASNRVE